MPTPKILPAGRSFALGSLSILVMIRISATWYILVAARFSARRMVSFYWRARKGLDRIAGIIFIGFGLKVTIDLN